MAEMIFEIKWETRLCEIDEELGYFHTWEQWSNVVDASPLRGSHPGGVRVRHDAYFTMNGR